jgi:DNA-binding SARP family transcriptional activator
MARLSLTLLGGFSVRSDAGPVSVPTKKAQALLAYLALPLGQAHPRDKLASLLWGDTADEQARASLRQALFALRKALPVAALRAEGETVALDPARMEVDVAAFERRLAEGTPETLAAAAGLYHGDLLAGLALKEPRSRSGCWASGSACARWRWRGWRSSWRISAPRAVPTPRSKRD